ncbi:MAG: TSUP family transporter [Oligoflexus sp.]
MSIEDLFFAGSIVAIGSLIQSTIGFGLAIVTAPILMWLDPALVPAPLIIIALFLSVLNTWRHRQHIALRELSMAYIGRLPGTLIAMMVLGYLNQKELMALVGFSVLFAVFISLGKWQVQARPSNLFIAGLLSGFMGTIRFIDKSCFSSFIYEGSQKRR